MAFVNNTESKRTVNESKIKTQQLLVFLSAIIDRLFSSVKPGLACSLSQEERRASEHESFLTRTESRAAEIDEQQ
jgi:hypothetical protein